MPCCVGSVRDGDPVRSDGCILVTRGGIGILRQRQMKGQRNLVKFSVARDILFLG